MFSTFTSAKTLSNRVAKTWHSEIFRVSQYQSERKFFQTINENLIPLESGVSSEAKIQ